MAALLHEPQPGGSLNGHQHQRGPAWPTYAAEDCKLRTGDRAAQRDRNVLNTLGPESRAELLQW